MAKQPLQDPVWVIFDGGNSLWKFIFVWIDGKTFKHYELVLPHAIVEDETGSRFSDVKARYARQGGNGDIEWFGMDGSFYVVGRSAESEGVITRRTGTEKYTRNYMGVAMAAGLIDALPQGHNNLHLYVSFPPGDVKSVDELIDSLIGKFTVETSGTNTLTYRIRSVQPYDEPLGAYVNSMSDLNGTPYKDHYLERGNTLVIDIGGKISNVLRVLEGGRVAYGAAKSIDLGMQDVREEFVRIMRAEHPQLKKLRSYDEHIIRSAIASGKYEFKGDFIDVQDAVRGATNTILNRLNTYYTNDFSGGANDRNILVTGGGGGAMFNLLKEAFGHNRMFLADSADAIHLANARGGARMCRAAVLRDTKGKVSNAK